MNQLIDPAGNPVALHSLEDWQPKREAAFAAMMEVMGPLPDRRCPLEVKIEEERDSGSYLRQLITYSPEPGCRTPAYLLIPKACRMRDSCAPGVLALHGADFLRGHRCVANPENLENPGYGAELAERGYVVVAPAYPMIANYQKNPVDLGYISGTMKAIWDNLRALDLLDELPFVCSGDYAAIGASLGGHNALFTAVFDDRIQMVVSGCGMDSFQDYRGGDLTVWSNRFYMPRLQEYPLAEVPFDFHDVLALLAPRDCFISAPLQDFFSWQSAGRCVEAARRVYQLYGAEDRLRVEHPDCGHHFPRDSREAAYARIDQHFGWMPRQERSLRLYQVDAFASETFRGNPAAVCLLDDWLEDGQLQAIAAENNLAETAFLVPAEGEWLLRWFTPVQEVALCGHATLASAYVLFACCGWPGREIRFQTRHKGCLIVTRKQERLELDFPASQLKPMEMPVSLAGLFAADGVETYRADEDIMVVLDDEAAVRSAVLDLGELAKVECRGLILTAPGEEVDFVSRFFAPRYGIPEDPVTGSAHCALAPYWCRRLGKAEVEARQLSARGGELRCRWEGERVKISGNAVLYLTGKIQIPL